MKPKSEWGPADEAVEGFTKTATVLLALGCSVAFGYGAFNAISNKVIDYKHGLHWNKRGIISCINGVVTVAHIDFSGEWYGPGLDMEALQRSCKPAKGVTIENVK